MTLELLTIILTLIIIVGLLFAAYAFKQTIDKVIDLFAPLSRSLGKAIENLTKRRLPEAARVDFLFHILFLFLFIIFSVVIFATKDENLSVHLPILSYIFIGTGFFSYVFSLVWERISR